MHRSLDNEDVFYFDNSEAQNSEADKIFSLHDLKILKRKVIILTENAMKLPDFLSENIFVFLPLNSSFWPHNQSLLFYSIEFLLYDFSARKFKKSDLKGRIENIVRIQAQRYLKFLSQLISPFLENATFKYKWVMECPIGRMMLYNYLMSYFFLSWIEFEQKGIHLDIPIKKQLPQELLMVNLRVYEFLTELTGTA